MKILITGVTGFVGSHLAEYCLSLDQQVEVIGTCRWRSRRENIEHLEDAINLYECDLRDASSVKTLLADIQPERIFHLAAQSYVPSSWNSPGETITTNVIGQLNIFEAMRETNSTASIQIAGSSEEYGLVHPEEAPITEENPLRPLSPYAVSKVAQDMLAYQYFQSYGLRVVRTRAFNHTGPRRGDVFVTSNFAKQIAEIEAGQRPPIIHVGDLNPKRDFTDVRDIVRAYWLSLEHCSLGEVYNVASGKAYRIKEVLKILLDNSGQDIEVVEDPERLRPSDVPLLLGDNSRFCKATGWIPEIPFEQTAKDLLDYWRERTCA
ncbi:MAG TPA: GDP-mannose 4,6-dehydratase [Acidobacteriota bacterium]|jgi:GDP-4-dehydro-6-deoxy-D-mannose reductase|nr:GDP-mannose 4,6-dehydratase [Acidobacteriota bacterium]|tara:strand:- start:1579 stop:2541 length:963 start_codon:yes stop_codon:yes gene_type:complete